MACGDIELGSEADCDNLPPAGSEAVAIVYNYGDIDTYSEVAGKITEIILKAGKSGYKFTGLGSSFLNSQDFSRSASTGLGRFKHKNTIIVYERTQAQKDNLAKVGKGRFVVALYLKGNDSDSIVLAGKDVGVELQAGEIQNAYANDGFFVLNLATPEGEIENETKLMQSIWITNKDTTEAMLEATLAGS